ncbi:hypothetical protein [Actinomadura roseirufa]|uniref:hypothetical protein n=1 Tax=Actinomadura roseirufa TaxID=2094049 RepID=UPI001040F705|nr:hypothetical protein [Actinomadura roseirufa]
MSRLPLGPSPGIGYGHLLSTSHGAFVTKHEWLVQPVPVERPERGWEQHRLQCPECGRTLNVRVSSVVRTRRRQRGWRWTSASCLALAVLCALLMIPSAEGLRIGASLGLVFGATFAFSLYMRLGVEDGVTMRWPTWTRLHGHMLRWPPGTPTRWQR